MWQANARQTAAEKTRAFGWLAVPPATPGHRPHPAFSATPFTGGGSAAGEGSLGGALGGLASRSAEALNA